MLAPNSLPVGEPVVPPSPAPVVGDVAEGLLAKQLYSETGGSGAEVVSNTTLRSYATLRFLVLTAATFSAVTASDGYEATGLTGVAFPAGAVLPFRFSAFTLTSGSVLAIKA